MKARAYIETTVISYYTARPSRDVVIAGHQQATRDFWGQLGRTIEPYLSALVIEEVGRGDRQQAQVRRQVVASFSVLDMDGRAEALAKLLLHGRGIPTEYPEDALHVAIAAVHGMDLIVTWNFAHINNSFTRMLVRQIVENAGYGCPEIVSPDEISGGKS